MSAPQGGIVATNSVTTSLNIVPAGVVIAANPARVKFKLFNPPGGAGTVFVIYSATINPTAALQREQLAVGSQITDDYRGPIRLAVAAGARTIFYSEDT